jgi:hypothetical protein
LKIHTKTWPGALSLGAYCEDARLRLARKAKRRAQSLTDALEATGTPPAELSDLAARTTAAAVHYDAALVECREGTDVCDDGITELSIRLARLTAQLVAWQRYR